MRQARYIERIPTSSDKLPVKAHRNLDDLPGSYGLPFLGHTLRVLGDPRKLMDDLIEKHGYVVRSDFLFQRSVMLIGPDANELVTPFSCPFYVYENIRDLLLWFILCFSGHRDNPRRCVSTSCNVKPW